MAESDPAGREQGVEAAFASMLQQQLLMYSDYHAQKETVTWTALGLYVAFVAAGVGLSMAADLPRRGLIILSVAAVGVWLLAILFVREQLKCKSYGADAVDATTSLLYGLMAGRVAVSSADFVFSEDQFQPQVLVDEMHRQRVRRRQKRSVMNCLWLAVSFRYHRLETQERVELLVYATLHLGMVMVLLALWSRLLDAGSAQV